MTTNSLERFGLSDVKPIRQLAGLTAQEMAGILGVSTRKLSKGLNQAMSILLTEKLLQVKSVFEQGLRVFANNPVYLNRWLKMPNQHLTKADKDFQILDLDYTYPTEEELFSKEMPDLLAAAQQNQEKLKELLKRHPFPDKPYPTPLSLLDTTAGIQFVSQLLGQIEYGVYI